MTQPRPWLRSKFSLFHTLGSQTGTSSTAANHISTGGGPRVVELDWGTPNFLHTSTRTHTFRCKRFQIITSPLQRWKFHLLRSTSWSNRDIIFAASLKLRDLTFLVLELMRLFWPNPARDWIHFTSSKESSITTKNQAQRFRQPHTTLLPLHCLLGLSGAEALAMQDCSLWSLQWKRNWSC